MVSSWTSWCERVPLPHHALWHRQVLNSVLPWTITYIENVKFDLFYPLVAISLCRLVCTYMHTSRQPKIRAEIHQLGVLWSIWRAQRITLAEDLVILRHICISPKASSSKTYSHVRHSEYLRQRKRNVLFCSFAMGIRNAWAVALKSS